MATTRRRGDSSIFYTPPDSAELEHVLAIPLWDIRPVDRQSRYEWWSEEFSTREIVTVGDGVFEIFATIRLDDEPVALKRMLRLALRHDLTLTYRQNGAEYPMRLVAVVGANGLDETPLERDRDRHGYGEWECRLHLRRTDGGNLSGIYSDETE
jgi:hypothetical protein